MVTWSFSSCWSVEGPTPGRMEMDASASVGAMSSNGTYTSPFGLALRENPSKQPLLGGDARHQKTVTDTDAALALRLRDDFLSRFSPPLLSYRILRQTSRKLPSAKYCDRSQKSSSQLPT